MTIFATPFDRWGILPFDAWKETVQVYELAHSSRVVLEPELPIPSPMPEEEPAP